MPNKYLITGGTGFIGGRLIEKLIIEEKAEVTAIVRSFTNAARIARFNQVKMYKTQLDDTKEINDLVDKHDVVIHLAYDSSSQKNNINAINTLSKACMKYDKRLVHISTISVYEPLPDSEINEESVSEPSGMRYADRKLEIESKVFKYIKEGLDAVILQPTIVYGPFSAPWTDRPAKQLLSGTVVLPNQGIGVCNAVYVDDVCKAIILSCGKDGVSGERFLISGSNPISWKTFYSSFEKYLKVNSIKYMSYKEIKRTSRNPFILFKIILGNPVKAVDWEPMKSFLMSMQYKLPSSFKARIKMLYQSYKKYSPPPVYMPNKEINDLYAAKCCVNIDKAKNMLNYNPDYDFDKGMALTGQYLEWAYMKSNEIE